jgi:hypothetical protein
MINPEAHYVLSDPIAKRNDINGSPSFDRIATPVRRFLAALAFEGQNGVSTIIFV